MPRRYRYHVHVPPQTHVATAFPKFAGVIACVAPGALLTRPLLTAKPLDRVYEGL